MHELSFSMPLQQEDLWCWAAVSCGVSHFYDAASAFSQCSIATTVLGITNCCANHAPCNQTSFLDKALACTGNFVSIATAAAPIGALRVEIDGSRPLCVRTQWAGGGGHFVALTGYDDDIALSPESMVRVQDPFYGPSTMPYRVFLTAYRGDGRWTHSYLTCP
jgi:hypothetical protein